MRIPFHSLNKPVGRLLRAAVVIMVMMVSACVPDEEEEPTPTDDRDKFVHGNGWSCAETSSMNGNSTFTVHINKSSSNADQVVIENFYGLGFPVKATATVNGNSLTIASQQLSGNTVQGSGNYQANGTVTMNYTVNTGSGIDTCSATLTKK